MKKSISDLIFNRKFRDEISKNSLDNFNKRKKDDPDSTWATIIAYVLKFKRIEDSESEVGSADFEAMKERSLEMYRENRRSSHFSIGRIAAAASILILFAVGGYLVGNLDLLAPQNLQSQLIEFKTPKGQQSELTLPDGTFVALNYDSKLKYRISQNNKLQEVELEGEAFFKVTKNKSRTFRVITADMNVTDLGTEFDVRAYKNDLRTETTLLEGSCAINGIPSQKASIVLKPGEMWSLNKQTGQDEVSKVDPKLSTLWRSGEYYFEKVSLGQLANTLERMYKVTIHFQDSSLEKEVYSGSVFQDDSIDKILGIIGMSLPIHVRHENNQIWITRK